MTLLLSEICRLILGFFEDENLLKSYQTFLNEAVYLNECREYLEQGKEFPKIIHGKKLLDYLWTEKSDVSSIGIQTEFESKLIVTCDKDVQTQNLGEIMLFSNNAPSLPSSAGFGIKSFTSRLLTNSELNKKQHKTDNNSFSTPSLPVFLNLIQSNKTFNQTSTSTSTLTCNNNAEEDTKGSKKRKSKTIKRKSTNNLLSTPTKHQHTAEFMTSYSPNNSSDESGNNDISIAPLFVKSLCNMEFAEKIAQSINDLQKRKLANAASLESINNSSMFGLLNNSLTAANTFSTENRKSDLQPSTTALGCPTDVASTNSNVQIYDETAQYNILPQESGSNLNNLKMNMNSNDSFQNNQDLLNSNKKMNIDLYNFDFNSGICIANEDISILADFYADPAFEFLSEIINNTKDETLINSVPGNDNQANLIQNCYEDITDTNYNINIQTENPQLQVEFQQPQHQSFLTTSESEKNPNPTESTPKKPRTNPNLVNIEKIVTHPQSNLAIKNFDATNTEKAGISDENTKLKFFFDKCDADDKSMPDLSLCAPKTSIKEAAELDEKMDCSNDQSSNIPVTRTAVNKNQDDSFIVLNDSMTSIIEKSQIEEDSPIIELDKQEVAENDRKIKAGEPLISINKNHRKSLIMISKRDEDNEKLEYEWKKENESIKVINQNLLQQAKNSPLSSQSQQKPAEQVLVLAHESTFNHEICNDDKEIKPLENNEMHSSVQINEPVNIVVLPSILSSKPIETNILVKPDLSQSKSKKPTFSDLNLLERSLPNKSKSQAKNVNDTSPSKRSKKICDIIKTEASTETSMTANLAKSIAESSTNLSSSRNVNRDITSANLCNKNTKEASFSWSSTHDKNQKRGRSGQRSEYFHDFFQDIKDEDEDVFGNKITVHNSNNRGSLSSGVSVKNNDTRLSHENRTTDPTQFRYQNSKKSSTSNRRRREREDMSDWEDEDSQASDMMHSDILKFAKKVQETGRMKNEARRNSSKKSCL